MKSKPNNETPDEANPKFALVFLLVVISLGLIMLALKFAGLV
jgi:hypothetical protein